jgi:hypothetical protein
MPSYVATIAPALLLLLSCNQQIGAQEPRKPHVYKIAAPAQKLPIEIVIDPINKGLGSELPWRLGVAFTMEELRRFFAPDKIPISAELLDMFKNKECNGAYIGDSPVSMIYHPSLDHTILRQLEDQVWKADFEYQANPKVFHGLMNLGGIRYKGNRKFLITDDLRLPGKHKFGFEMTCGLLEE